MFRRRVIKRRRKKLIIVTSVISALVLIRIFLPEIIKTSLNNYLEDFSPSFTAHVDDVDLAILRMTYRLEGITATIKKSKTDFLKIAWVETKLPWADLLMFDPSASVKIEKLDFLYTSKLTAALKEHAADKDVDVKKEKEKVEEKEQSLRLTRLDVKKSLIRTDIQPSLTREQGIVLTDLEIQATNLLPTKTAPLTPISMQAQLLKSGLLKVEGELNLKAEKLAWSFDTEIKHFNLKSLNRFLYKKLPLDFTKGQLDLYAEAASENGRTHGYVKPFIKDLDVVKKDEDFKGTRHWMLEIISAIGNLGLRAKNSKSVATKLAFTMEGDQMIPDAGGSLAKAIEHGFFRQLSRGIENSVDFRQAEEEKK